MKHAVKTEKKEEGVSKGCKEANCISNMHGTAAAHLPRPWHSGYIEISFDKDRGVSRVEWQSHCAC